MTQATTPLAEINVRVRQFRRDRGMTQLELAEASGLSPSFISQFERGHSDASLASLVRICTALSIKIGDIFGPQSSQGRTLRRRDRKVIDLDGVGSKFVISRPEMAGVDVCCVELAINGSTGSALTHAGRIELIACTKGTIGVELGGLLEVLAPGDSIDFPSSVSHRISNEGLVPAEFYWVIHSTKPLNKNGTIQ
ncbi:XRE family transcriptional regulator [Cryobacterium sp. TMT1-3]|uniref:helix-turn-helix domain-containing protein n=1 Tax=Cryobacterium sp. TMT1-3 TaxID=1259237 RepID=UPI00106ADA32|nr:XRE family transcriptional regulator [Cryobacterium sp. TMT1-3]TFC28587.1 XRE family transcriptional regulator [Cryobacterium sp. TMT1-3]